MIKSKHIKGEGISICLQLDEGEIGLIGIGSKECPFYPPPKLIWIESRPIDMIIDGYFPLYLICIIITISFVSIYKNS